MINQQPDINKTYLYEKGPCEAKYQLLINKRESAGLKHFNGSKYFIEHSNDTSDIYKNTEKYNPNKKRKISIVFHDIIADMLRNKNLNPLKTELFIRGRKLDISLVFITESYFAVPKSIRPNSMHYFVTKIPNKKELQQVVYNHSLNIDFRNFMNIYKKWTAKPYSFWVIDATLASYNSSHFRKNLKN